MSVKRSTLNIAIGAVATAVVAVAVAFFVRATFGPKTGWPARQAKNVELVRQRLASIDTQPNQLAADPGSRVVLGVMLHERLDVEDVRKVIETANGPVDAAGDSLAAKMESPAREKYLDAQRAHLRSLCGSVLAEYLAYGQIDAEGKQLAMDYINGLLVSESPTLRRAGVGDAYEAGMFDIPATRQKAEALKGDPDASVREMAKTKLKQWDTLRTEWLKSRGLRDVGQPE
ncbi:MAG: hypothetical protein Q8L55_02135 [Phycisphaerales bacterium]|nr:hypothetical protein [Phycisphaerales bacterium]